MAYTSSLEARLAKKMTKAIVDFELIEGGDRVMVGLSGGKDSWALMQLLDVLRQRAPVKFSLVAVTIDSGYEGYQYELIARTCEARGWDHRIERTGTRSCGLPVVSCCCPVCGDLSLQRQRIKRLLLDLEREHPGVKASMLRALGQVAPRHLLDRRLPLFNPQSAIPTPQ